MLVIQSCPTLCNRTDHITHQALVSMEFSRQEYWSGLPFPSPGDLPYPGIKTGSPALQVDSLPPSESPGKPEYIYVRVCAYICVWIYVYVCIYTHICAHMYIHMCTHTHTYIFSSIGRNMWQRWRIYSDVIFYNFLLHNLKSLILFS